MFAAMRPIEEHHGFQIRQIETHDRLADRQGRDLGLHLGDHGRRFAAVDGGLRVFLRLRRQDVLRGAEALRLRAMMIAEPALVAAHALGEVVDRQIESGIGLVRGFLRMHQDAATDMDRDIGTEQMRLLRKDDSCLDRIAEIFSDGVVERLRDVGPQRLSDVDVLTFDRQIHGLCPTDGFNAAQLSRWPFGLQPSCPSDGGPGPYVPPPPKSRAASPPILGESCNAPQAERKDFSRRRWTEDGIFNDSRYLATVRRAMSTPSFLSTVTS